MASSSTSADSEAQLAPSEDVSGRTLQRDVVVVGASAGGVEALATLVSGLPPDLPAAAFVVLHVLPGRASVLPKILGRACALPVATAVDGERIERGRIYVAPPDHHMLLAHGHVSLTMGPPEKGHRPALDPLFRSAARAYGRRVIGAVLSGALDDGAAGLRMISDQGGLALVQDSRDALYPSMPSSALEHDPTARSVPIAQLAAAICAALDEPLEDDDQQQPEIPQAIPMAAKSGTAGQVARSDDDPRGGLLTAITCPQCGGTLSDTTRRACCASSATLAAPTRRIASR